MPSVDFLVRDDTADDAVHAARAILAGLGFRVVATTSDHALVTRGNRVLTVAFGALVPVDRHWQRMTLETVRDSAGPVALRLRAHDGGAAVASAHVQRRRTAAVFREAADRIAATLSLGGHLVAQHEQP